MFESEIAMPIVNFECFFIGFFIGFSKKVSHPSTDGTIVNCNSALTSMALCYHLHNSKRIHCFEIRSYLFVGIRRCAIIWFIRSAWRWWSTCTSNTSMQWPFLRVQEFVQYSNVCNFTSIFLADFLCGYFCRTIYQVRKVNGFFSLLENGERRKEKTIEMIDSGTKSCEHKNETERKRGRER